MVATLDVEHLFTVDVIPSEPTWISKGPKGTRAVVEVESGTFEGERLRGVVLRGHGADWVTMRRDGSFHVDVRILLRTHDDAAIVMTYNGLVVAKDGVGHVRLAPLFETGDERYAWLNRVQAVALGTTLGAPNPVHYDVFELL